MGTQQPHQPASLQSSRPGEEPNGGHRAAAETRSLCALETGPRAASERVEGVRRAQNQQNTRVPAASLHSETAVALGFFLSPNHASGPWESFAMVSFNLHSSASVFHPPNESQLKGKITWAGEWFSPRPVSPALLSTSYRPCRGLLPKRTHLPVLTRRGRALGNPT